MSASLLTSSLPTPTKLSPTEQIEFIREARQRLYRSSLSLTCEEVLGYADIREATHSKMVSCLESDDTRKLIVMPRGTFKSSIGSVCYPIWSLTRNTNLRILLDSELYSNSKNFLRVIKGHIESTPFRNVFGDWVGSTWNEGEIVISARTKLLKEASITCSGIGAQKTGQHYDLIVADDLNSAKNSSTPEGLERVINHYRFYTSLLEPGGTLAIIGTRYDANDVIGHVLRTELGIDDANIRDRF